MSKDLSTTAPSWRRTTLVALTGVAAGLLSGLFGVGGGLVIVPALIAVVGMEQRRASATSLAAIVVTAAVGACSYGLRGEVSLVATCFLVPGALVGTQLGAWLLRRLPSRTLPWVLIGFVGLVVVLQQLHVPVREATLSLDLWRGLALVGVGLLSGIMAGLIGVGGGSVIVPGLELAVGLGDLLARGTSLLVMLPTAITGTWTNLRHGLADLKAGVIVGTAAAVTAPFGTWLAAYVTPKQGSILFSLFLIWVATTTLLRARRQGRRQTSPAQLGQQEQKLKS
ncbi:Sulfite exporter TauE/SafE [Actinomyces bovis]|uniref:Probable membrane transporter protein n=1 Tax=Actinomyces bovis TaxID=1658 RepID=A0ABY1VPL1_9ACTO|nr:sulfite exporter TauE/SafE family protein [Actinomyces bovis]SPT54064.1 Sulfite exporter TauE/SafE [Actinomyces bovis]VEG53750.1 Sulfite exporter TauE/SafE [Actinomyces israelii]